MNEEVLYSKLGRLLGYDKLKSKVIFRNMDSEAIFKHIEDNTNIKYIEEADHMGIVNPMSISGRYDDWIVDGLTELVTDLYEDKYRDKFENLIKEFHKEVKRELLEDDIFTRVILDNIKIPEHHEDGGLIFVTEMVQRQFYNHINNEVSILIKDIKSLDIERMIERMEEEH